MQWLLEGALARRLRILVAIVLACGAASCAQLPGSAGPQVHRGCCAVPADHPELLAVERDIAAFLGGVKAGSVRFEVQDCPMDGQVADDRTIILSVGLARLSPSQRYFIMAHEFGHLSLGHQAPSGNVLASMLDRRSTGAAGATAERAHRLEFEADAFAVRMMRANGVDPQEAVRMFDTLGAGEDSSTHPAFARRAKALRELLATSSG